MSAALGAGVSRLPGRAKALADSGFFIGLFNPKDHHHARCKAFAASHAGLYVTTWAVFAEVCAILPANRQKPFFEWATQAQQAGYLAIESPPPQAVAAIWQLMGKYSDLPMDFCDASLVYLAIHLKIQHIATVDRRDFSVYRLPGNRKFEFCLEGL